jgi:L-lactate dehydrogenase complex protein LldG
MYEHFIQNLKLAGGEVVEEIPNNWYVAKAKFGVAENGAVWVEDYTKELFLSENVVIKLKRDAIFEKMTDVMEKIERPGVFISGPSKTADVESFLVFGAHGPKRVAIFFE